MKKNLIYLPLIALLAISSTSCKKEESKPVDDKKQEEEKKPSDNPTPTPSASKKAVILYTNDVHCALDQVIKKEEGKEDIVTQMGYSSVASYKKEMINAVGKDNVLLVDNGDHLQGGYYGTLSTGLDVVNSMNAANYDLAIPGNHEFDFGMDRFLSLASTTAKYEYISSNFVYNGTPVFKPYSIKNLGGYKIAFLGATTPDTYTSSTPKYFKNSAGQYVYTFSEGATRSDPSGFYNTIQKYVDEVKNVQKADYVVLMAHLGIDTVNAPYMSTDLISNISGVDVVLDGHSHSTIASEKIKDKNNKEVILTSTGTKLANIGKLTIENGKLTTELVSNYGKKDDTAATEVIEGIINDAEESTGVISAYTGFDLNINDETSGKRRVRKGETNLGDLIADGFQAAENDVQFAFVNGGGVRNPVTAGGVSLKNIMNFQPFGNKYDKYKTKGQVILDFLEYSVYKLAKTEETSSVNFNDTSDEFGGYMQCSKGIKYSIDTTVETPVVMSADGKMYDHIDSEKPRRIHSVQVATAYDNNGEPTTWADLDPNTNYIFASTSYYVENQGDGYNMFFLSGSNANITRETQIQKLDWEVSLDYFKSFPSQVQNVHDVEVNVPTVPAKYEHPAGRVTYAVRAD